MPEQAGIPDEAALLAIANAAAQASRQQHARDLLERMEATSMAPLVDAQLLVETRGEMLALAPQFLAGLVARDQLMQSMRDDAVERWAMYCYDPQRCVLVDAAMRSRSIAELLPVLDRIKAPPVGTLAAIGAAEALFREIGKRLCGTAPVPETFACLAEIVVSRMDIAELTPCTWTSPVEEGFGSPEWLGTCWAWSRWCVQPPLVVPETWTWWFLGWAQERADAELPFLWPFELPEHNVESAECLRLVTLAARLATTLDRPTRQAPGLVKPMLLVEGLRGRWDVDPSWLGQVVGHQGQRPSRPAEDLVVDELERIGPPAAARLLPALMTSYLLNPNGGIRHVLFYRSTVRTWALQHISVAEATSCLTELQWEILCQAPHTLPPHLMLAMLLGPDTVDPGRLHARVRAVHILGADQADILSRLVVTPSLGMIAAERLCAVAPETAERLLNELSQQSETTPLQSLIWSAPADRTGTAARAILSCGSFSASEWRDWATQRLPTAGSNAELLGRILETNAW